VVDIGADTLLRVAGHQDEAVAWNPLFLLSVQSPGEKNLIIVLFFGTFEKKKPTFSLGEALSRLFSFQSPIDTERAYCQSQLQGEGEGFVFRENPFRR
jgi:hypothetical protein